MGSALPGMQARFQDMGDPEFHFPCGDDMPSGIGFRIDDRTGRVCGNEAGAAGNARNKKLVDAHMFSSFYQMRI
jgi:hypothetical protein